MQINIENILFFLLFIMSLSLAILYFQSLQKLRNLNKLVVGLFFKNSVLEQSIPLNETTIVEDVHKENFIKFLSDSRDWAFEYIDKSQKQIKEFVDMADKEFAFFDSFGLVLHNEISYETMKKISEEYKKLKNLLPEESDDRR